MVIMLYYGTSQSGRLDLQCLYTSTLHESMLIVMTILPAQINTANITPNTQSISNLLDLYTSDLPSPRNLDTELDLWKNMWEGNTPY